MKHSLIIEAHNIFTIIEDHPTEARSDRRYLIDELLRIGRELTLCDDVNQSLFDSIKSAVIELRDLS